jgi:hypothetical protein
MSVVDFPHRRLEVSLLVDDPQVVGFLSDYSDPERAHQASLALRIGVLALYQARGAIDVEAVRHEGEHLIGKLREVLSSEAARVSQSVGKELAAYLDPKTGVLPQRLERLVATDGDLERVIKNLVDGDSSAVAKTLAAHVGEASPLFKKLDPTQRDGLLAAVEELITQSLAEQHAKIAGEFTLDDPASAMSRLVRELTDKQGELQQGLSGDVEQLRLLLSLDQEDSALSRLVRKVEEAQVGIVEQFSLDSKNSALSRLKGELVTTLGSIQANQAEFQGCVLELLGRLDERHQMERAGTLHGHRFEEALGRQIKSLADGASDLFETTGNSTGLMRNCKKGDFVVTVGAERAGNGRRIVVEAKEDKSYTDARALGEIEECRKNRNADVGIFVFSRSLFPATKTFRRFGRDLVVVWDSQDPASDVILDCAYSVAMALVAAEDAKSVEIELDLEAVEKAVLSIEKQADRMQKIRGTCETIQSSARWIDDEARKIAVNLARDAEHVREQADRLRAMFTPEGG